MASTRPIRLEKWDITWEEYKELTYFCLQYERKRRDAAALLTTKSTAVPAIYHLDGKETGEFLPRGVSDPVAAKRDRLLADVRMIERAAMLAGTLKEGYSIYASLLRAVTTRSGVQSVMANPDTRPPCGKNEFYAARRKFFWVLRELREVREMREE